MSHRTNEPKRLPALVGLVVLVGVTPLLLSGCPLVQNCLNGTDANGQCITGDNGDPCNGEWDCDPNSICWNSTCITEGALRFSLSWDVVSDFDLHVLTPNAIEVYYGNSDADGGFLDVDDCVGNACRSDSATHVENIVWDDSPPSGTYEFWVVNYNGGAEGTFEVEVEGSGSRTETGTLSATAGEESTRFTYSE